MADLKITQLPAYSTPIGTDLLAIVDMTTVITKKITVDDLLALAPPSGIALTDLSALGPLTYDNTTGVFSTSMATDRLIGRYSVGTGQMEEIIIGSGLDLSAGILTVTGAGTIIDVGTTSIINGTIGAVPFHGGSNVYQEEPTLFYWSPSNNFLGVGLDTPSARLHVKGNTSGSTAFALKVDNLAGSTFLHIRNDGVWALGLNATASIPNQTALDVNINGSLGSGGGGSARVAVGGAVDKAYDTAIGPNSNASGPGASSLGAYTNASAQSAIAVGMSVSATGIGSVILGSDYNGTPTNAIPRSFMLALQGNSGALHKQSLFVNWKTNIVLRSEDTITDGTHYDSYTTNTVTIHNGLAATAMTVTSVSSAAGAKAQFNFASNNTILLGDKVVTSGFGVYSNATFYLGQVGGTSVQLYPTRADAVANTNSVAFISTDTGTITPQPRNPASNISNAFQLYCDAGQAWILPGSGAAFQIGSGGGGGVTSVSGTANRITSTGGATPVIDISATFEALLGKVASPLSQFAATTSLQLKGVISDETGSGALVFADTPTFAGTVTFGTTPVLAIGSGGVLNFNAGDVLITHSADTIAVSGSTSVSFNSNVVIGGTTLAASATAALHMYNGTIPSANITDGFTMYAADFGGTSMPHFRGENGNITRLFTSSGALGSIGDLIISFVQHGFYASSSFTSVPANEGGTGLTSYAVGDILYANSSSSFAKLADVATGNALISGGVGVAPSWGKIDLTAHITGVLPVANGGTNKNSIAANKMLIATSANTYSETDYQNVAEQAYGGSAPAWGGSTAPSGASTLVYTWFRIGNQVNLKVWFKYAVAGSANSSVTFDLPSDCPTPREPSGLGATNDKLYSGTGWIDAAITGGPPASRVALKNKGATTYEILIATASVNAVCAHCNIWYEA